jgi:hypothetical protein
MGDGPLTTARISPTTTALNAAIPDGISAAELTGLKSQAAKGIIPLIDINATMIEVQTSSNISEAQRTELMGALEEMRSVAAPAAQRQSDAIATTLGVIDTLNPFAYARAALGGARVGLGSTW